jgi:cation diffusion facilitator CzcD-associated flavoprotein CzcO
VSAAVTPDYEVLIVGSGFAGLGMAIRLKRAGESSFVVLEQGEGIGGTWRVNDYPGCACDVQSHLYSFSFALNPEWTRMFAPQEEIQRYLERCADEFDVRSHVRLESRMTCADWNESEGLWHVEINEGQDRVTARVLVPALGALSRPAYPEIEGIETFNGRAFHSADWDHDLDLAGKRVAVIGTGASAIQFLPQIAARADAVTVFQRTPPWIIPKPDRQIGRRERRLYRRLPFLQRLYRSSIYWRLEARVLAFTRYHGILRLAERVARRHIHRQIADPELRRQVTPDYTLGCKRVLISNDYLAALDRQNVQLVTDGIARVTEGGVVAADGAEHDADVIVFGTGFRPTDLFTPLSIHGRHGIDVNDAWSDGVEAHRGTTVAGFPNMFLIVGPNTGLAHSSMITMIESQVEYVLGALRTMRDRGAAVVEVRPDAQARYNDALQARLGGAVWSQGGCSSWYLDATGRNRTLYPGFTFVFRRMMKRFDEESYELTPALAPAPEPAVQVA